MIRHALRIEGTFGHASREYVMRDGDSLYIEDSGGGPSVIIPAAWFATRTQALDGRPHTLYDHGLVLTIRSMPAIPVEP